MLSNEQLILFCEKTKFLTSPSKACLVEALKLDIGFGLFLKESIMANIHFESCEDFLSCYKLFAAGLNSDIRS